jgi:hypothetical protein
LLTLKPYRVRWGHTIGETVFTCVYIGKILLNVGETGYTCVYTGKYIKIFSGNTGPE